jgi:putative transposase
LNREFSVTESSKAWVFDITYIRVKERFLYLTTALDGYDRKIVGWSLSNGTSVEETSSVAGRMAIKNRYIEKGLVFQSDRGIQYTSKKRPMWLIPIKWLQVAWAEKENCCNNAVAESFSKTLKTKQIYGNTLISKEQTELNIFEFIEMWYNRKRRRCTLDYKTIEEFRKQKNIFKNVA